MFFIITNIVCGYICAAHRADSLSQEIVNSLIQKQIEQINQQKEAEGIACDIEYFIKKIPSTYHPIIAQSCDKYVDNNDDLDNDLQAQIHMLTNVRAFLADFYYDYQRKQLALLHTQERNYLSFSTLFLDSTVPVEAEKKKLLDDQNFPIKRNVGRKDILTVQDRVKEKKQDVQSAYHKALGTGCIVSGAMMFGTFVGLGLKVCN